MDVSLLLNNAMFGFLFEDTMFFCPCFHSTLSPLYVLQLFNFNEVAKIAVSAKNNFKIYFSNINIIP